MTFTNNEIKRYNRQIILPEIGLQGQQKLKNAKILVIGAGGLGCPVLQYLTAAGVGTIGICDFDLVDESNLQRQILFGTSDIGKPKALTAAEKLANLNPYIQIITHNELLTRENVLDIFKDYEIIVDCSDNFPTRFLINDACVILNLPFVFGAIYKFEGQVTVFNFQNGPTYRCMFPEQPDSSELLSCSTMGVLGVLPGIIGTHQACEVIKMITEIGEVLSGKILIIDTLRMDYNKITMKRSENFKPITELGEYTENCTEKINQIKQLNPLELADRIEKGNILVIDIREKDYFEMVHMESENIPISQILQNPNLMPQNQDIAVMCTRGISSQAIIEEFKKIRNINNLYNVKGGIQAWINSNLPIITNSQ